MAEDGREFYAVNQDCPLEQANPWVRENVLSQLYIPGHSDREPLLRICTKVKGFVNASQDTPRFIGYYADYDWVCFCQMFGTMMDLPKGWPQYCLDLKQWAVALGNPKLPEQQSTEHNALFDARHNKAMWHYLWDYEQSRMVR